MNATTNTKPATATTPSADGFARMARMFTHEAETASNRAEDACRLIARLHNNGRLDQADRDILIDALEVFCSSEQDRANKLWQAAADAKTAR